MKVVHELVTYFDRRQKLSRRQLRRILDQNQVASDPPGSMHGMCDVIGTVYYFRITGVAEGQVWGSGPYTRDSVIGAAAVHAGLLKPGQTDVLRLTVVAPEPSYPGSVRNGVTTTDYAELSRLPAVRDYVQASIDQMNARLNRWETIKDFRILDRDLTVENGEVTPSMKVRRKAVETAYRPLLDTMYEDVAS